MQKDKLYWTLIANNGRSFDLKFYLRFISQGQENRIHDIYEQY